MKILTAILNFYLQSSIHVALAVTSLAVISVIQIGFVPEPLVLIFIFLGTIVGYNFVKYAGVSNLHNLSLKRQSYSWLYDFVLFGIDLFRPVTPRRCVDHGRHFWIPYTSVCSPAL